MSTDRRQFSRLEYESLAFFWHFAASLANNDMFFYPNLKDERWHAMVKLVEEARKSAEEQGETPHATGEMMHGH